MYIHTQTLEQTTEETIKQGYPSTSFPSPFIPPEVYAYIFPYPKPEHDSTTHYLVPIAPELTNLGHWEERWEVLPRSQEQVDSILESRRLATIPTSVTPRQIRQALTRAGLRASLETTISQSDQDTKDWYEFATEFRRDSPVVAAMGVVLGVSTADLDNLWILAGSL
jgi:hypothetical protein